jgi:fatty acid desaturase
VKASSYPIPERTNLILTIGTVAGLTSILFLAGRLHAGGWAALGLAAAYGLLMNTGYALAHESIHGILHKNRRVNLWCGIVVLLFFPAPYHLIRQGHLGHHMRNRSDDEAFDFYFEGESVLLRWLQIYGVLTGFFWVSIVLSNFICVLAPRLLRNQTIQFERTTVALQKTLNPRYDLWMRGESLAALALHATLMMTFAVPFSRYIAILFGFGFLWSAMQYVHHYGTTRDVLRGARNLKTLGPIDRLWLNHNWHLNHHVHPTVPWIHLPRLESPDGAKRKSLVWAYLRMWRGPRFSSERVQNRFAGRIIQ